MKVPFLSFEQTNKQIREEVFSAFERVYDSQWYILGEELASFEKHYAKQNAVNYAIGVANGLDALCLSLKVLGVGSGDEVIVPSNTYIATALAISYTGATPVFVEPDLLTYNIDTKLIIDKLSSKTKAIMPVHLYGQACKMDDIMSIAKDNQLFVIEDNAQAHFAKFNDKLTGSFGDVNASSFYPGKNLGALGDAGIITTDQEKYFIKLKALRNYGSQKKYYNEVMGINSRLDEVQAAFLNIKLKYMEKWNSERENLAHLYSSKLDGIGDIVLPYTEEGATHVYHLYVIRTSKRDELKKYLEGKSISTLIHYPVPIHLQEAYKELNFGKGDFPIAEEIADTCLSLPLHIGLSSESVEYVSHCIREFYM